MALAVTSVPVVISVEAVLSVDVVEAIYFIYTLYAVPGKIDTPGVTPLAEVVYTRCVPVLPVTVVKSTAAPVPMTTLYCRVAIAYVPAVPAAQVMSMYGEVGMVALDTANEARVGAAAVGATSASVVNSVPAVSGLICPEASMARKKMV
jgi:hypothetical protein